MENYSYNEEEFHSTFSLSLKEIYAELGDEILDAQGLAASNFSNLALIAKAKEWLEINNEKFCRLLCKSNVVKEFLKGNPNGISVVELFAAVFDVIATAVNGYAVFLTSIVIVKKGVLNYCSKYNCFSE